MAEKCNSWPRKDFWRHIGEALLKVRQLNVVLEGECLKVCVSDLAHAVFRYVQASKRPANIMAS
jgi:hypothetical protein